MNKRRYYRNIYARDSWQTLPNPRSAYAYFNRALDDDDDDEEMMARVRPSHSSSVDGPAPRAQSVASLQFDEKAQFAEDVMVGGAMGGMPVPGDSNEGVEAHYIQKNIKCRECRTFHKTDINSPDDDNDKKCQCGYFLSQHRNPEEAVRNGSLMRSNDWDHKTHAVPVSTNAFGEIEFVGFGDKVAKYVRLDTETDMNTVKTLMMDKWHMERPNLLISVTGGAKNFLMRARLKDAFRRGLMKAALSTGAWIVTGGTNAGVMKHVGEAVRDYGLTAEGRVVCIGIAPWGCVQNKEVLESDETVPRGKWPAMYRILDKQKPNQSFLDPNHSHFILVDNGTQHKFAIEIEFRAKLEKEIARMTTNTGSDAVQVPVALLVLEGGPGTLKTVMNAIMNNTPAIVIKGSGKCADVLACAAQKVTETEFEIKDKDGRTCTETQGFVDEKLQADIQQMVEETFGKKNAVQHAEWVKQCIQKPNLISVFELESAGNSVRGGVDVAILKALLKANKGQVMDQLKLALAWNRIDIAKSEIFTDERPWPSGALDDMMMSAIQLNRVSFVDLFLDNGVSLKDFLTVRRLLKLYNEIPKNCLLYTLLMKIKSSHRKRISLEDVGILLQDLLGDYFEPEYLVAENKLRDLKVDIILSSQNVQASSPDVTDGGADVNGKRTMMRPAQDLFLWAVLMNQKDLAKLFWREGNESTAAALVANSLLKAMKSYTDDTDVVQRLQQNADEFEELAIGVINSCYSHDEQKAQDLLVREMNNWGRATCVLIAVQADNKRFISQTACQSLLNSIWMGKMSQDNSLYRLIPSMFIFPLIWVIIKFQDEEKAPSETYIPRTTKKALENRPPLKREPTRMGPNFKDRVKETTAEHNARLEPEEKPKGLSNCAKLQAFYTAPVVIFVLNCISYLVFLALYSYILVVQLAYDFHFLEGILITWVFTIFVEELRQLVTNYAHSVRSKLITYVTDSWNLLDIITIFLFMVGMILRFIPDNTCFTIARVILALNLISFFFRILHIFSVNKELGPKLVMIRRMIRDLMWFVVILMVFIGAYAIASEAILYPQTELSWKLFYYLPRKAYWQIYGELFLEEIEGTDSCTDNSTLYSGYNEQRCPSDVGKYLVPILMGIYVLMTNVLLLNLLIAMFSYTFQKIQENTDVHWYYQRFTLIHEYYERPWLPPPFILFIHMYMMFMWCLLGCSTRPQSSDFRKRFTNHQDEKRLVQWENIIADTYLTKVEASQAESIDGKVKVMMQKLDSLQSKMDDFTESQGHMAPVATTAPAAPAVPMAPTQPVKQVISMPPQLDQRLGALEDQMVATFRALNWIMQSMQASDMTCSVTPPALASPRRQKESEKREDKKKELKKKVSAQLEKKLGLHVVSRSPIYPNSFVGRYPVPDEMVPWHVKFDAYDPVTYTAATILKGQPYADTVDLTDLSSKDRKGLIPFNDIDANAKISRISYEGNYSVVDGLPLNPYGRTGLDGRGLLGRWGPNIAGDPLVTRWKYNEKGECKVVDGKPVLEFIAVKREDNKMWAIPGAILLAGEQPWDVLTKYFTMEALGSLMDDPESKAEIESKLKALSQKGVVLYQGYADDARNTDNAWLETCVVNYHDDTGKILTHFDLRAGLGTSAVSWLTVSSKITLHGAHLYFLKLAAEKHGAAF